MIALIVLSCALIVFGLAETGLLDSFPLGRAPDWLGVIVPIGIVTGMRRIPSAQRLSWGLVALGWLVGVGARAFGLRTVSIIGLLGFGTIALGYTVWQRREIAATDRPLTWKTFWTAIVLVILTMIILLWPPL